MAILSPVSAPILIIDFSILKFKLVFWTATPGNKNVEKRNGPLKFEVTDLELHLHNITGHVLTLRKGLRYIIFVVLHFGLNFERKGLSNS